MITVKLKSSKGMVGEELPAIIIITILLSIFIISLFYSYTIYLNKISYLNQQREATSKTQKIFMETGGIVTEDIINKSTKNMGIKITNLETNKTKSSNNINSTQITTASVSILILENGNYYPGKLDIYVGE
jgi:hypothetical protein